jgi:hypothetical protein
MNPIFLRRKDALIHGTFVVKPSLHLTHLIQHFADGMSVDALHNFQASADGGAIDVDIWLVDDQLPMKTRNRALLAEEMKASVSLEIQNPKDSLVVKLVNSESIFLTRDLMSSFVVSTDQCLALLPCY